MSGRLIAPRRDFIAKLIKLPEKKLEFLYGILDSEIASAESDLLISSISKNLEISIEDTFQILNAIGNLSTQKASFEINDTEFIQELKSLYEKQDLKDSIHLIEEIDKKSRLILKLLGPKPNAERFEKVQFLETGLIKTANNFRSFCDIRPLYDSNRTKIEDLITIIIVGIEFENDDDVVFQLNRESFAKLKDFVEFTDNKLRVLDEFLNDIRKG